MKKELIITDQDIERHYADIFPDIATCFRVRTKNTVHKIADILETQGLGMGNSIWTQSDDLPSLVSRAYHHTSIPPFQKGNTNQTDDGKKKNITNTEEPQSIPYVAKYFGGRGCAGISVLGCMYLCLHEEVQHRTHEE